jgi:hypothetical protein
VNVPRFNAEAALYRPSKNYRLPANRPYLTANPGVQPAALTKPIVQSIEDWLERVDNCTDDCPDDWGTVRCGAHYAYT